MTSEIVERLGQLATEWQYLSDERGLASAAMSEAATLISSLVAENEELRAAIATPESVHANMLRGGIPKLSIRNALHLHGADALAKWDQIETAERLLAEARATIAEIAGFDPEGPIDPDTVRLIRIAGAYRRKTLSTGGVNG